MVTPHKKIEKKLRNSIIKQPNIKRMKLKKKTK
jgi:hypothetical protein